MSMCVAGLLDLIQGTDHAIKLCDFDLAMPMPSSIAIASSGTSSAPTSSNSHTSSSQLEQGTSTSEGPQFWGTAEYVSPEVIEQGCAGYSSASDWWAVGVLTYELLFGRSPFRAPNMERLFYNITMRAPDFTDVGQQVGAAKE